MFYPSRTYGFTLIELLIVIAIVLILIAIALPNFLEAQTRARITKSNAEMKTIATAIEAFRSERGVLLIDFWDDWNSEALFRMNERLAGVGHWEPPCSIYHNDRRSMACVLYPLTSPVRYLTEIPYDIFAPEPGSFPVGTLTHDEHINLPGNRTYLYADRDSGIKKGQDNWNETTFPDLPTPGMLRPLKLDEFTLCGFGPALERNLVGNSVRLPYGYSPTNGSKSLGMLYYRSSTGLGSPY